MKEVFLRKRPCTILLALRDASKKWHVSALAREAGASYVHAAKIVSRLEASGLASSKKTGRVKSVALTEKGAAVASALGALKDLLEPLAQALEEKKEKAEKTAEAPPASQ